MVTRGVGTVRIPNTYHGIRIRPYTTTIAHVGSRSVVETTESKRDDSSCSVPGYGMASTQGPRETMEDVLYVVENGPCGYMFASRLLCSDMR